MRQCFILLALIGAALVPLASCASPHESITDAMPNLDAPAFGIEEAILDATSKLPVHRSISQLVSSEGGCCACTKKVAHHIISSIQESITKACGNVTCPVLKAQCDWIAANEEQYAGYLVARVKPAALGWSYCLGNGECKHPNMTRIDALTFEKTTPDFIYSQLATALPRLPTANVNGTAATKQLDLELTEPAHRGHCKHCLRRSVRFVMHRAVEHVRRACDNPTCPVLQKFCPWAEKHKPFVLGLIYGKVEPWKFAVGYCAGRGCIGDKEVQIA